MFNQDEQGAAMNRTDAESALDRYVEEMQASGRWNAHTANTKRSMIRVSEKVSGEATLEATEASVRTLKYVLRNRYGTGWRPRIHASRDMWEWGRAHGLVPPVRRNPFRTNRKRRHTRPGSTAEFARRQSTPTEVRQLILLPHPSRPIQLAEPVRAVANGTSGIDS
jgi:hypothetical protein